MSESHAHLLALIRPRLASYRAQALAPYLAEWRVLEDARSDEGSDPASAAPLGAGAAPTLPVLRWLPRIAADAHSIDPKLVRLLCHAAPSRAWRQTYGPDEVGAAHWRQGDAVWRERPPGTLIHHCSEEIHAMRTGDQPLLALYLWRSERPSQKARLEQTDTAARDAARPEAARQTGAGGRP